LGKFDWGVEQLELLMAMPEQADSKKAEWLGLMAAWQIRFRRDGPTARLLLDRILREYPNSVQAMAARRRIELMEMDRELRGR
jgi:hypothetical protein